MDTSHTLLDGHARSEVPLEAAVPTTEDQATLAKVHTQKWFAVGAGLVTIDPACFVSQNRILSSLRIF